MDGKKIRIFHKGIAKQCSKCYSKGHLRSGCPNKNEDWLTYVDRFMINEDLDETFYGNWVGRIADWRLINPEGHQANVEEAEAYWQGERRKREQHREEIGELVQQLEANSQAQLPQGGEVRTEHEEAGDEDGVEGKDGEELQDSTGTLQASTARESGASNRSIEAGVSELSFGESGSRKNQRGRLTTTAATAAATAAATRKGGIEAKMKTRSSSLGKPLE